MNTRTDTTCSHASRQGGWLWISAAVLGSLILVQGAGLFDSSAHADMTVTNQSYSMMTTDGGTDEVLVVIDSRQESLLVYRVDSGNKMQLHRRESLDALFANARAQLFPRP